MPKPMTLEALKAHRLTIPRAAYIPSNVRQVSLTFIGAIVGFMDPKPVTGKVIYIDDMVTLIRPKPSEIVIIDNAAIQSGTPALNSRVTVQAYVRKDIRDGLPLTALRPSGDGCSSVKIGANRALGRDLDWESSRLRRHLEEAKMPDGQRTLACALTDWNPTDFAMEETPTGSTLRVTVRSPGFTGNLTIQDETETGMCTITLDPSSGALPSPDPIRAVPYDALGTILSNIGADTETWFAVTVTHATPARKAA